MKTHANTQSGHDQATPAEPTSAAVGPMAEPRKVLAVVGWDSGRLLGWDWATGKQLFFMLAAHELAVMEIVLSPDGRYMATTSADGETLIWLVSALGR